MAVKQVALIHEETRSSNYGIKALMAHVLYMAISTLLNLLRKPRPLVPKNYFNI